ncbi:DoxX family protein [Tamlana sp. 2_MG-2023]|uniref:DoxX family protein n=1 Tax=unclassified Tamlana TaxID=2614803 RepID=UPI0026E2B80B|nr:MULTISPECIES: DoxX family protein [unclassified Tamlana]MDO6761706.1 DoxX family protein [Tamlana sp. 2_MG-2023]MDO6792260.1 DoxX family protein [Tamlana sp. 1_MG-2023]
MRKIFITREYLDNYSSKGILILRLVAGFTLFMHGFPKVFFPTSWMGDSIPGLLQLCAVFFEVIGGLVLIFGFFVPIASLGIGITMAVAVVFHITSSDPLLRLTVRGTSEGIGSKYLFFPEWFVLADGRSAFGSGSSELALLFLTISACLFFTGAGKYSLDYYSGRVRKITL